jgi:hypothetical protein
MLKLILHTSTKRVLFMNFKGLFSSEDSIKSTLQVSTLVNFHDYINLTLNEWTLQALLGSQYIKPPTDVLPTCHHEIVLELSDCVGRENEAESIYLVP